MRLLAWHLCFASLLGRRPNSSEQRESTEDRGSYDREEDQDNDSTWDQNVEIGSLCSACHMIVLTACVWETDDYRYFDPKMLRGSDSSVPRNKNPFQEAIVFIVGGGNYIEYQNLIDYIKGKQGKHVLYGCSELFNATQFIKQLSQLGQK